MLESLMPHRRGPLVARSIVVPSLLGLLTAGLAACGAAVSLPDGVTAADGYAVELVAEGFVAPTQMSRLPGGDIVVGELNGGERDATGRISRVVADDWAGRTVLQEGLDKPTGLVATGDDLWIMERRQLSVTSLEPGAPRDVLVDELPFNGRSQGTLTVTPGGGVLFNTSGAKQGPEVESGSGRLFTIADRAATPELVASGLKHGYAHTFTDDDTLFVVEMTDGDFDGVTAVDELVVVAPGDDLGWPRCVGNNRPVAEYGVTADDCDDVPRSHALFGAHATPTDVVIAPWDPEVVLVALWVRSEVVAVPRQPGAAPHEPAVVLAGVESPQSLLVDGDCVLVADHESGSIYRLCSS